MNDDPRRVRRAVLALPNGFTLASLFFGIFAIVVASRGTDADYDRAALYIVTAMICDGLDGRIARATRSSSRFGEELDSLVDGVSFGLAPALLMYFAALRHEGWDWVLVFLFAACALLRLARFNIEQAGRKKRHFIGLPSPAAGGTLVMYYWFSQTSLFNQTFLATLPPQRAPMLLMAGLAFLMISNVPYPTWPTFSIRTARGVAGLVGFLALVTGVVMLRKEFLFPVGVAYVLFGLIRAGILGLLDRVDDNADQTERYGDVVPMASHRPTRRIHGRPSRHLESDESTTDTDTE